MVIKLIVQFKWKAGSRNSFRWTYILEKLFKGEKTILANVSNKLLKGFAKGRRGVLTLFDQHDQNSHFFSIFLIFLFP